jgi:hypothetical protein
MTDSSSKATDDSLAAQVAELRAAVAAQKIASRFELSNYVAEKLTVPADMLAARFGSSFAVENGQVVGRSVTGSPVFSRMRLGEIAEFDEALELLIQDYPYKDAILKKSADAVVEIVSSKGKARPTMKRALFDKMTPQKCMDYVKAGGVLVD